ncbi:MAG: exo-alpha-sialidase [Acidobacteriota bacterium]
MTHSKTVHLLVGTHKGGFLLTSDLEREKWETRGLFFKGTDINHMILDQRREPTLYACVNSLWWGPDIRFSLDFGETWQEPKTPVRFKEGSEQKVKRVWCVTPGRKGEPGVLFAGVDPATLFRTEDGGRNWTEVESLTRHPTREKWMPGAGGMMVHSICPHPTDSQKIGVGISAAGTFCSEDGGASWEPRNKGVRAEFLPDKFPQVGQCVHHMESHPDRPEVLYQQNHDGVYRSDNEGLDWTDISQGLPSRFGFPLQIHPRRPDTIYVIPEEGAEFRGPVNAAFAVYRSRNRGVDWERLDRGLPSRNAYLHVFRQAMCADSCESTGLYFGTSTGHIFHSRDGGDCWELLANWLPPIFSLSAEVL